MPNDRPASEQTEAQLQTSLRRQFGMRCWHFSEQYDTGSGRIDFVLFNKDAKPELGIEIKRGLSWQTAASDWADYLEQAQGYSRDLSVPVLVGPLEIGTASFSTLHHGGAHLSAAAAMVIYGGRSNVGVFAVRDGDFGFVLRGKVIYAESEWGGNVFHADHLKMVYSRNSQKVRA